jgi:hypothetical protein
MTCLIRRPTVIALTLIAYLSASLSPTLAFAQANGKARTKSGASAAAAVPQQPLPLSDALTGAAKDDYESARLLLEDGDAAAALHKFRSAYQTAKDPRLLWNMAVCEKQQRHYAKMLPLIEQYLADGGALVTERERTEANAVVETLKPFVGTVEVQVNEPQASISVDGETLGVSPLPPVRLDLGPRRIAVAKEGYVEWTSTRDVPGGGSTVVSVELAPIRHVGTLRIVTDVAGDIRIDGKPSGRGRWEGELPSGTHNVEVMAPGMQNYQGDAAVLDNQTNTLRIALRPVSSEEHKSGVPWLWIGGGTALATGLAIGAYFLFRPSDPGKSAPVSGSMDPGYVGLP